MGGKYVGAEVRRVEDPRLLVGRGQYVDVALRLADRAVVLDKGRCVLRGTATELSHSPDLLAAYLSGTQEVLA